MCSSCYRDPELERLTQLLYSLMVVSRSADESEVKSQADFALNVRAAIRGLWSGQLEVFDFVDSMVSSIQRWLKEAWLKGAGEFGISEAELTPQEQSAMMQLINGQLPYLPAFAQDIVANDKASGGKLTPLLNRSKAWINRYQEAYEMGKAYAAKDRKGKWVVGPTEHCTTCAGLDGRVYRYSTWQDNGAIPRSSALECRGYLCQCSIVDTDERITPGRFPRGLLVS